jgi:hypothetical protein
MVMFFRQGNDEFAEALVQRGFKRRILDSKTEFAANPLVNGTQDDLDLHFTELEQNKFKLMMFTRQ